MEIEIKLSKAFLAFSVLAVFIVIGFAGVSAYNAAGTGGNPAIFGHSADEINTTQKAAVVNATSICLGAGASETCRTDWGVTQIVAGTGVTISSTGAGGTGSVTINAAGGGGGIILPWATSGNNIYNTTANVGIGTSTPTQKLDVSGNIKGTGLCIGTGCITSWASVPLSSSTWQKRVSGTCSSGSSIRVIAADGTVTCESDSSGTGLASLNTLPGPAVTVSGGSGISISRSGNTITVTNSKPWSAYCSKYTNKFSAGYVCGIGCVCTSGCNYPNTPNYAETYLTCNSDGTWTPRTDYGLSFCKYTNEPC